MEANKDSMSNRKKVQDKLIERLLKQKNYGTAGKSKKDFNGLIEVSSHYSEFSKAIRGTIPFDLPRREIFLKIKQQRWSDLLVRLSEKPEQNRGLFAMQNFEKGEYVCDYHGVYITLKTYLNETFQTRNDDVLMNKYILTLPSFDPYHKRFDRIKIKFGEECSEEDVFKHFKEDEMEKIVAIDAGKLCECHGVSPKGGKTNHSHSQREIYLKPEYLTFFGHFVCVFKTTKFVRRNDQFFWQYNTTLSFKKKISLGKTSTSVFLMINATFNSAKISPKFFYVINRNVFRLPATSTNYLKFNL